MHLNVASLNQSNARALNVHNGVQVIEIVMHNEQQARQLAEHLGRNSVHVIAQQSPTQNNRWVVVLPLNDPAHPQNMANARRIGLIEQGVVYPRWVAPGAFDLHQHTPRRGAVVLVGSPAGPGVIPAHILAANNTPLTREFMHALNAEVPPFTHPNQSIVETSTVSHAGNRISNDLRSVLGLHGQAVSGSTERLMGLTGPSARGERFLRADAYLHPGALPGTANYHLVRPELALALESARATILNATTISVSNPSSPRTPVTVAAYMEALQVVNNHMVENRPNPNPPLTPAEYHRQVIQTTLNALHQRTGAPIPALHVRPAAPLPHLAGAPPAPAGPMAAHAPHIPPTGTGTPTTNDAPCYLPTNND
jgi:hypothetical protein